MEVAITLPMEANNQSMNQNSNISSNANAYITIIEFLTLSLHE